MSTYNGETSNYDKDNRTDYDIHWIDNSNYAYGCGLDGEKLFLLSVKEALNEDYGFRHAWQTGSEYYVVNKRTRRYDSYASNSLWWLRSAYSSDSCYVARVNSSGRSVDGGSYNPYNAVRFALNIPLSAVLFASDASSIGENLSPSFAPVNQITLSRTTIDYPLASNTPAIISATIASAPTNVDTTAYIANTDGTMSTSTATGLSYGAGTKLTIVDDSRKFAITQDIVRGTAGSSISVNYTNASIGANEYISAIIKDTSGEALYHAKLDTVSNSNGSVSMDIPDDIEPGEYMLVIYNELERGSYNTNYAGYDTLILVVWDTTDTNYPDEEKPTMTNVYKNVDGTRFRFTASDNHELYQMINSSRTKLRDLAGTNVTTNMSCDETQDSIIAEDLAGNISAPQNIITDITPPKVTISYSRGTYTLTVSDNESGVWKIANHDGSVVYHDYSC